MKTVQIIFIVEKTKTGFSAYAENFEAFPIGTTGKTLDDLKANILEAANLYLEYINKTPMTIEQIKISFDVRSFFEYYGIINAKAFSERIGMNNALLGHYIKGIKRPSEKQVSKIMAGLKQVGKELTELEIA